MRRNLVNTIKHQVVLHDHKPESIAPVPRIVLDDSVGVHLDPKVEQDESPTEYPTEDVHGDRMIGRKMEVGPSEAGVRDKVAKECQRLLRQRERTTHLRSTTSTNWRNINHALNS